MSVKVKYVATGLNGFVSVKVAEILEKRGAVEILEIEDAQQTLDLDESKGKPAGKTGRGKR
jgi:hypothetical protein